MRPDERDLDDEIRGHIVIAAAAILATLTPAARAARVNVLLALRSE